MTQALSNASTAGPAASGLGGFGGFTLGDMALALPMSALREVVARTELLALPCAAPCVVGGINLRDVVVPVIDLRIALGMAARPLGRTPGEQPTSQVVIVMVHAGRIVGLLADAVTGIFEAQAGSFKRATSGSSSNGLGSGLDSVGSAAAIFEGGAKRADELSFISVLSPAAVASLPALPMVDDPEPSRGQPMDGAAEAEAEAQAEAEADAAVPVMLLRCGGVPLAIEAMAVHATLASPKIQPSALAMGHCRGVTAYGGTLIPAIDLQSLCGLGTAAPGGDRQALLMSLPDGKVAFLVDSVVDVVSTWPKDVVTVPTFALPHATFFLGALLAESLACDVTQAQAQDAAATQYLMLNAAALRASADVVALSQAGAPAGGTPSTSAAAAPFAGADRAGCTVVTFRLHTEQATPIDQLTEILAYRPESIGLTGTGPLKGYMVNRGRSIPILDLALMLGYKPAVLDHDASVLVVESAGEWVGFAVPELKTIEVAAWEMDMPAARAVDSTAAALTSSAHTSQHSRQPARPLALVGTADDERLLPMLHLREMAGQIQRRGASLRG